MSVSGIHSFLLSSSADLPLNMKTRSVNIYASLERKSAMKTVNSPNSTAIALSEQNTRPTKLQILQHAYLRSMYLFEVFEEKLKDHFPGWRIKRVLIRSYWTGYVSREYRYAVQKRVGLLFWRTYSTCEDWNRAIEQLNYHYSVHLTQETVYFKSKK